MYIVSACLAGYQCRYNGTSSDNDLIKEMIASGQAIALCPEVLGGLLIPREKCEMIVDQNGKKRVISESGIDHTKAFTDGAEKTLAIAKIIGCQKAFLKSNSPSCGFGIIYDGTFTGKQIKGHGLAAELLAKNGINITSCSS